VVGQLSAATEVNYRAMLERAVAALDAEAEELTRKAVAPFLVTNGRAVEGLVHVTRGT
jgi:hypothetical protein